MIVGNPQADCCIYLPNVPTMPAEWHWQQPNAIQQLIELNSNHWRKIWVISAKIIDSTGDWRACLQHDLMRLCSFYCAETAFHPSAKLQMYSGKAVAEQLSGMSLLVNGQQLAQDNKDRWHLPYFDYRQFPNALIEEFRQLQPK